MRVKQFLLQEPTEGRVRTRHRVYNLVCLGLTGFASTLMVFNNSFSFRLFLLPLIVVVPVGFLTGEEASLGFGYLTPLARGLFVISLLAILLVSVTTRMPPSLPASVSYISLLLGFTVSGLILQILWIIR
jgi:hypothetical protein